MNFNNTTDMDPAERRIRLQNNPNVLFPIERRGQLHILQFNPADALDNWLKTIQDRVYENNLSVQVNIRNLERAPNERVTTIQLSGNLGELQRFLTSFPEARWLAAEAPFAVNPDE